MTDSIRPGQLTTLLVLAAAPGLLTGQGSFPVLLWGAGGLALLLLPASLSPGRRTSFPPAVRRAGAGVVLLYLLGDAARSAAGLGQFAAKTELSPVQLPVLTVLLVLAASCGAAMGLTGHARASGLWAGAGILLLGITALLLLPEASLHRLQGAFSASAPAEGLRFAMGFGSELILLALFRPDAPDFRPRHACFFLLAVTGLGLLCTGLAHSVLGSWSLARSEPLYTAVLSLSPEAAFRPDSLYTLLRIAAGYSRTTVLLLGAGRCMQVLLSRSPRWPDLAAASIFTAALGLLLLPRPDAAILLTRWVQPWGTVLGAALPLVRARKEAL